MVVRNAVVSTSLSLVVVFWLRCHEVSETVWTVWNCKSHFLLKSYSLTCLVKKGLIWQITIITCAKTTNLSLNTAFNVFHSDLARTSVLGVNQSRLYIILAALTCSISSLENKDLPQEPHINILWVKGK